jgi:hypothetical protein
MSLPIYDHPCNGILYDNLKSSHRRTFMWKTVSNALIGEQADCGVPPVLCVALRVSASRRDEEDAPHRTHDGSV